MSKKMNRETMVEFINQNKELYLGNINVENVNELSDEDVQKLYRSLKTKVWNSQHRKLATMTGRIEMAQTYDECEALRKEIESYLPLIDERMATLKAEKIESLKNLIIDSKNQLKELQG